MKRAKRDSSRYKLYEIKLQNNSETLYISVRGMGDGLNEFRIQIFNHRIESSSSTLPFTIGLLVVIIIGIAIVASIAFLVAFIVYKKKRVVVRPTPKNFKK